LTEIAGSAIMSDTAGSVVKHNVSTITAGSYSAVIVDTYGHVTDGSTTAVGLSTIAGSSIMSDTTGSVVKHNISAVTPGAYLATNLTVDSTGHITVAENGVSASSVGATIDNPFLVTGSSADLTNQSVITAGSNIEIVTEGSTTLVHSSEPTVIFIHLNQSAPLTGTEKNYARISPEMNGYNLVGVAASCSGSSTSGSVIFEVKSGSVLINAISMLTTNITIDEGEYDSSTSSASAVINTDEDDVATADQVWVLSSTSGCGTDVTYAGVELTFQLP